MRILITTLILLVAVLHPAIADTTWGKGDKVSVFYMCREEKDILDVALADSKNFDGACSRIFPPVILRVGSVVSQYRDHKEKNTTILKLYDPVTNLKAGYIIAAGVPLSDREASH